MTETADVLIVGGGHAGAQAAIALRQHGFTGTVVIVSDETEPPYERPPLSKDYLAGERTIDRIRIRPPIFWDERRVRLILGRRVAAVHAQAKTVTLDDGGALAFGSLIWAAGGRPRRLQCAGADLVGLHTIRSRADVDRLRDGLPHAQTVAVIGGGYIGLEAAAVLSAQGKNVVVLEALDRVLARVAGEPISHFYEAEHRRRGVDIRTGVSVACVEGTAGRVSAVRLATGEIVLADIAIVGIGIDPCVQPLLDAGAEGGQGVIVDDLCRTSLPDIYAVGDCALHRNRFAGGAIIRLESVQNAHDQASTAVSDILGAPAPYDAMPWFWSNQYDLKLQTVGLSIGHDATVVRGDPDARSFSVVYLRNGRVIALDCVNAVKDYVQGRKLVTEGAMVSPEVLAETPLLKDLTY